MADIALPTRRPVAWAWAEAYILRDLAVEFVTLFAAYLVATYLRRQLPFGKYVGTNYEWHHPQIYLAIATGLIATYALEFALGSVTTWSRRKTRRAMAFVGIAAAIGSISLLDPRQSGLEKIYFMVAALILVLLLHPWPTLRSEETGEATLRQHLVRLWANRALLRIWVQYNVQSRYSQTILGVLWIILFPLAQAFILAIVFSQFLRISLPGVPFVAFFLAGFVPWTLFNQGISAGMRSILGAMGLINQIYFPREIIVLSALGEALVDTFFLFLAMLVINAIAGIYPNPWFVLLPLLFLVEIVLLLGIMLVVSYLSVLVRDIPQLVSVLLQLLFYLSPIIYPLNIVPRQYHFLITLNPTAAIIEAFHDVIVYGRPPDWWGVIYPAVLGVGLLVFGYRSFKSREDDLADLV